MRELNQIPECVIIMDDIYTTGSTMEACSAVLKETGIRRIYFCVYVLDKAIKESRIWT